MATLEEIGAALKNADAAGDTVAAKKLADAYVVQRNRESMAPPAPLTRQQEYEAALENVRLKQYPDMPADEFAKMAGNMPRYQPANLGDLAKSSMTFGVGDEIDSAMGAMGSQIQQWLGNESAPGFGEAFANEQALQDARLNLGREQNGLLGTAAEIIPGMLTMAPARAGVEAAVRAGAPLAEATPSLLRTATTGAAMGAGMGAIGGFTSSQGDIGDRTRGALEGGAGGALLGGSLPLLFRGAGSAWNNIATRRAANEAAKDLGVSPDAARFVQTRLGADDSLSPEGLARISSAGDEGMLADAGQSARNTLDYIIQSSGGAGRVAQEAIDARVTRDAGAISDALDAALGTPQGVESMRAGVRQGTAAQRSGAYGDAYAQPIDYSSEAGRQLDDLLTRVDPAAITRANQLMRTKGEKSAQIIAEIGDDGQIVFRTKPDVRQIDYITRALNEEAEAGIGAGAMGGQTSLGQALQDLSRDIRGTLTEHIPQYGEALRVGRSAIETSKAIQNGYEALGTGTTREQVAEMVRGLSASDKTALAAGMRSRLDDALANVTRTVMDGDVPAREAIKTLRDLSTRASRDKVALVIGDAEASKLFAELDRATKSFELRADVAGNSKTFQRQEMNRQVDAVTNPDGILAQIGRGKPVNATQRAAQAVTGLTPERALASKDAMLTDVAQILMKQGPDAIRTAQVLQQLGSNADNAALVRQALIASEPLAAPAAGQYGQQRAVQRPTP